MRKSMERAMEAAVAVDAGGGRVTSEAIDSWLRARDGVGCSMREGSAAARPYRAEALRRIGGWLERIENEMAKDGELREWERAEIVRQLVKRRKSAGRVGT
jgi:hypothetical protein